MNQSIPSANTTPVPRHAIIDPKEFTTVCVHDTMFRSLSITLKCVVLDLGEGPDISFFSPSSPGSKAQGSWIAVSA